MECQDRFWKYRLPERWSRLGYEILRANAIDEDRYQNKVIKERLMDAMAAPNILALLENAQLFSDLDNDEVLDRMGLDRGTLPRWLRDAVQPHPRVFFGLLLVGLRKEFDEVTFPQSRSVIWETVARTLAIIREKDLGRDRKRPSREEFACVRELMRQPAADALAPPAPGEEIFDPAIADDVLAAVLKVMRSRFSGGQLGTAGSVLHAIAEWSEPYVLFRLGLLSDWGFLNDDPV